MMTIRLQHKLHGYTHVYDPITLEQHKALGWTECEPPAQAPSERDPLVSRYAEKFGRRPHPKMTLDKLKEAVA